MVRKVLSLYKAGNRLTKQSFRDEDEQELSEIEDEENEEDPYEHVGCNKARHSKQMQGARLRSKVGVI